MPQLLLRKDARKLGLKRYYTGKLCKYDHRSERNVGTGQCLMCMRRKDQLRRMNADPAFASAKNREKHLKAKYGITLAKYMEIQEAQDGRCACCNAPETNLSVDHNHDTGKVRGLLCYKCNSMIGFALDNPKRLQLGIDYLEKTT